MILSTSAPCGAGIEFGADEVGKQKPCVEGACVDTCEGYGMDAGWTLFCVGTGGGGSNGLDEEDKRWYSFVSFKGTLVILTRSVALFGDRSSVAGKDNDSVDEPATRRCAVRRGLVVTSRGAGKGESFGGDAGILARDKALDLGDMCFSAAGAVWTLCLSLSDFGIGDDTRLCKLLTN